jgi:hypothetical protein
MAGMAPAKPQPCYDFSMTETAEQKLNRFECVIRLQMTEIDKLRAEVKRLVDWIMGDTDALTVLQSVYQNPQASEGNRIKAAAASLAFERPKISVQVSVRGPAVLGERLDQANGMKTINPPKVIDHQALTRPSSLLS